MSPWGTGRTPANVEEPEEKAPVIICMGTSHTVAEDEDFVEAISRIAGGEDLGKFKVYLNGALLEDPNDAPDTFSPNDVAEIVKDDYGG